MPKIFYTYLVARHLDFFQPLPIMIKIVINILVQLVLWTHMFLFLSGIYYRLIGHKHAYLYKKIARLITRYVG